MTEVRRAVAHDDLVRHADARERLALERRGIDRFAGAGSEWKSRSTKARGEVFDRGKALIEVARRDEPLQQCLRHRFAGLVVQREAAQHLGLLQPVLVKLRRQLDEIGGDAGAGNFRIGDVGQKPVQRVAELVEQRARVVEAEQRRLAVRGFGEVADVDDQRRDVAGKLFLVA